MGDPVEENVQPVFGPADMEKLLPLAAKYKIDILGPLPNSQNKSECKDHLLAI
jgi:hypothetical protein